MGGSTAYTPSESWVSSFLIHDDNFGSNFCVPRHYLRPVGTEATPPASRAHQATSSEWIAHVLCPLPNTLKMPPLEAELIGLDFLYAILPQLPDDGNLWGKRLESFAKEGNCVFRPVLVEGADYAQHLRKLRGWSKGSVRPGVIDSINRALEGHKVWVVEMSTPELFSTNLRKIGEVVLWSDNTPRVNRDITTFILARLPGYFVFYDTGGASKPIFEFYSSGVNSHTQLFGT